MSLLKYKTKDATLRSLINQTSVLLIHVPKVIHFTLMEEHTLKVLAVGYVDYSWNFSKEIKINVSFQVQIPVSIIIIMSCCYHSNHGPSLATSPNRSAPLAGLQGYIPYPHIAAVCMFEVVVLLLLGHMWGSIGVHHLWAHPCFSSSVLHVWLVMGGRWPYSWYLVGCCHQDLFNIARSILVQLPSIVVNACLSDLEICIN